MKLKHLLTLCTVGSLISCGGSSTGELGNAPTPTPSVTPTPTPTTTPTPTPIAGLNPRSEANVIFSGHSLLDNPMPFIESFAEDTGDELNSVFQTIPGSPIRVRTRGSSPASSNDWSGYDEGAGGLNMINEIRSPTQLSGGEEYDTLVITERHDLPGTIQWENTTSLLRHYHDLMLDGNPNAVTYLYHSWLSIDKTNPEPWIQYEQDMLVTWECVSSKVNLTLEDDDLPQNLRTIGAGWALSKMVELALDGRIPGLSGSDQDVLDEIFDDNVHLTSLGSFFVGAYTYIEVFGKSPDPDTIPAEIGQTIGTELLDLAWRFVSDYHARQSEGTQEMAVCRQHISDNICDPFWTYFSNRPDQVGSCQNHYEGENRGNPFHWPDTNLVSWPNP